jgi:putative tryptophan/tyrosine transport system substrate-binding protein
MMNRRRFIGAVAGALSAGMRPGEAQQGEKVFRIGFLSLNSAESARDALAAFRQVLQERGWVEDKNLRVEFRFAEGDVDRLPALAAELTRLGVDIIVAGSSVATRAAKNATKTIPIVMAASADALGEGFVTSLAQPSGNITGVTFLAGTEIAGKQLELLKEVVPTATRVAVLANPSNGSHAAFARDLKVAGRTLGTQLQVVEARYPDQLDGSFAAMTRDHAGALLVLTDSMFFGQRRPIADLAARNRLPAMYSQREFVNAGGLISYGPSLSEMFRHAATHVDKILRGAKPRDLPVEQPTKFELVINLRTAKRLGLTIPQSMLLRADQIIE